MKKKIPYALTLAFIAAGATGLLLVALWAGAGSAKATRTSRGPSARAAAAAVTRRTFLFVVGRPHASYYVDCYSPRVDPGCDAGWIDPEIGRWAFHLDSRTWVTGWESQRSAHYDAYARQRTPRLWNAWERGGGWGARIIRHGSRHWDVYKHGSLVAYAEGLNGVAAGLMWLADPAPRS